MVYNWTKKIVFSTCIKKCLNKFLYVMKISSVLSNIYFSQDLHVVENKNFVDAKKKEKKKRRKNIFDL